MLFDVVGTFKKRFTPVEGGYLFYPSPRSGGKLVTHEEHDRLIADWQRAAGAAGLARSAACIVLLAFAGFILSERLHLPPEAEPLFTAAIVLALSLRLSWAVRAPRRLVADRAPVTPPRAVSEARRQARAAISWPMVIFCLLFSGTVFLSGATASERPAGTWVKLAGGGLLFAAYIWIAVKKWRDSRR